jgi:hypothetical protein
MHMHSDSLGRRKLLPAVIVLAATAALGCQSPASTSPPLGTPPVDPNATAGPSPTPVPGGLTAAPTSVPGRPSPTIEIPPPIE